ncbi:MAG: rhomboid family intramembrane serine protease [Lentisphaeraceae bacterium]|nr:rhomboid family intramembrane serine protease [Lentisphaeraceae bacterium]
MSDYKTILTTKKAESAHTLVGILKQHNINAQVDSQDEKHNLQVLSDKVEVAKIIVNKHIKTPKKKNAGLAHELISSDCRVTFTLLALTIIVFFLCSFGKYMDNADFLFFTDIDYIRSVKANRFIEVAQYNNNLDEIKSGQVWRLFTPIFLHKSLIHFLFACVFLVYFCRTIEDISGKAYLIALTVASALLTNFIEFKFNSAHFGGMSAIIATLYGFVWMRSLTDVKYAGKITPALHMFVTALILSGFLNLFFVNNKFGPIAGLLLGVIWGGFSAKFLPQNRLIPKKQNLY